MPDWRDPEEYAYTDNLDPDGWAWEFLRRSPTYRGAWEEFASDQAPSQARFKASAPFNLREPVDPDLRIGHAKPNWLSQLGAESIDDYRPDLDPELPWSETIEFDLAAPLAPQLELARICLEAAQKPQLDELPPELNPLRRQHRFHRDKFSLYVRLLDAERAGASLGEMGRQLFRNAEDSRRSVKSALKTAHEIAAGGYVQLLWTLK